MIRNLIAAFAAPAIALVAIGISAALASNSAADRPSSLRSLSAADAAADAAATFERADLDKSDALDIEEYASLAVITAELARLNGYVRLAADDALPIALPIRAPEALAGAERARVEAVARRDFYRIAGDDGRISKREFLAAAAERFAAADRNRNGVLAKRELAAFAARKASLLALDA
ncbi:MAG: hypothetical protein GC153_03205 [Alphaproteobacteria bacterium]|nr:hypothetical protein [Alphaproteobacteria bacterium]